MASLDPKCVCLILRGFFSTKTLTSLDRNEELPRTAR